MAGPETPHPGLTAISYNVMYFQGFPPDRASMRGSPQPETEKAMVRRVREQIPLRIALELELYAPDIISLQEARGEENVAAIAKHLRMNYAFFPPSGPADFPGAIITRYDIIEYQIRPVVEGACPPELFTRHWGRALLQTDMGKVAVHTAHLLPFGNRGAEVRRREISEILKSIERDQSAGHLVLLLGDLNHPPTGPEYERWLNAGMVDTWVQNNAEVVFTIPSTHPRRRIDYIFANQQLADVLVHSRILYEGAFKTCKDAPASMALSDHLPVLAIFTPPLPPPTPF